MNPLDHIALTLFGSDSLLLDNLALAFTSPLTWLPLYLALALLVIKNHENMPLVCLAFACTAAAVIAATAGANFIAKPLVERVRPCNNPEIKYLAQIAGALHNKDYSFFSSHAATSMALVTFFALMVRSTLLTTAMTIWSLTECWTRLYLGQHYLTDILTGILWGITTGGLAYLVYQRTRKRLTTKAHYISTSYTTTGFARTDIDIVLSALTLTVLVVIMIS